MLRTGGTMSCKRARTIINPEVFPDYDETDNGDDVGASHWQQWGNGQLKHSNRGECVAHNKAYLF